LSSPEQTVFLYLTVTEQQYKKTVPEGEDSNMFSTQHLILDIKEKTLKFVRVYMGMLTNDKHTTMPSILREVNLVKR
jgi:aryl-phospho-beta-D-glucosidase BglC (GH1 family)